MRFFLVIKNISCRRLPSVLQPATPALPKQWSPRSLPCSKHHLSKCPERQHGLNTITLTDTDSATAFFPVFHISSTCTSPSDPASSSKLSPVTADLSAAATVPGSKSANNVSHSNFPPAAVIFSDSNTPPSTSTTALHTVSSAALQIYILRLLVPPSLLSSSELLLGTRSESPTLCAPASCSLRHYHCQ